MMSALLRGETETIQEWISDPSWPRILWCVFLIVIGCGLYGFTLGVWRSPVMGVYVGIKLPFLIFLTLLCNGLLNGLLSILLGSDLGFRQSILALLMSYAILALILGALAPVSFFFLVNLPVAESEEGSKMAHAAYLLFNTVLIGYTGITANLRLYRFLSSFCPSPKVARLTLFSWLAGNGFLGAQFSWILRPFFGSPDLEVAFLREDPFNGTFYGAVARSGARLIEPLPIGLQLSGGGVLCLLLFTFLIYNYRNHERK